MKFNKTRKTFYATFTAIYTCFRFKIRVTVTDVANIIALLQCQLYGQLELAIKNIVELKCRPVKLKPGQEPHSLVEKLSIIEV